MSTFERNLKGLLGTKLGMTQTWDENNRIVPVTVIAAGTNVVTQVRTPEKDGYNAIQIGFGEIDGSKVTKPSAGHFDKAGVTPRRHVAEIRTSDAASYEVGQELSPELFAAGQEVDVTGTSKGKGYAGVMKLHGFHGVGASHGAHRNHRKPGSIGACATPGRVFKGVRMAGHMGDDGVTIKKVRIVRTDLERNLLLVQGSLPGARGSLILVRKA
jgi:large subunit ribosomal protein L3